VQKLAWKYSVSDQLYCGCDKFCYSQYCNALLLWIQQNNNLKTVVICYILHDKQNLWFHNREIYQNVSAEVCAVVRETNMTSEARSNSSVIHSESVVKQLQHINGIVVRLQIAAYDVVLLLCCCGRYALQSAVSLEVRRRISTTNK